MAIADGGKELFEQLEECLIERQIQAGRQLLDGFFQKEAVPPASLAHGASLLFCFAQWIDLGYKSPRPLNEMYAGFSGRRRDSMPMAEFFQLRMVEAFLALQAQHFDRAVFLLETTIGAGEELLSPYQAFVAHFWMGRAQRLSGDFERSLLHIRKAREIAHGMNGNKLVAVTKIHESWLVFHTGEREQALQLLSEAEEELSATGHALSLANISAARGRFVRSSGQYEEALKHFERAIEIYSADHADHPNLGRALVNAAYVKRLMALQLQPKIRGGAASSATHRLSLQIAKEALELLGKAAEIYRHQQHQAGTGAVLVNTGYLHLESGDMEQAAIEALKAYELGEQKADQVLMARASILQGSVELAFCEEQLDEHSDATTHAVLAARYADRAVQFGGRTQNRRLLAAAYIVRGLIAADESTMDWALAREYATKASSLIDEHDRDHLNRELHGLNLKILRSSAINETVRAWCEGELEGKTFQQVEEEFAQIVIPRVWMRLDKKVSRVAQELSISPKKVRRILRAARHVSGE